MTQRRRMTAELAHDVAKYISRTALNVPEDGPFPPALCDLLVKDLYAIAPGLRASQRFDQLADPRASELDAARDALTEIDALEGAIRDGDLNACLRGCALARQVADVILNYARQQ